MCELYQENQNCSLINTANECSEKEKLSQYVIDDENAKDSAPELQGKSDISGTVPQKNLDKLANGVLSLYVDDMKKTSDSLGELMQNQNIVIETLQQENSRLGDSLKMYKLDDVFSKIKLYHSKVQVLKKDMFTIHERTAKLKKRAMRLQQQKQKEALHKELQRDRELDRDKQLAPKIATKSSSEK